MNERDRSRIQASEDSSDSTGLDCKPSNADRPRSQRVPVHKPNRRLTLASEWRAARPRTPRQKAAECQLANVAQLRMLVTGWPPNCGGPGMPQRPMTSSRSPSGLFDRRNLVGEDPGEWREVASPVVGGAEQGADGGLAFGFGIQVHM